MNEPQGVYLEPLTKPRLVPGAWIPAFAGMTTMARHCRACGNRGGVGKGYNDLLLEQTQQHRGALLGGRTPSAQGGELLLAQEGEKQKPVLNLVERVKGK